jgi:hypothetical protein
MPCFTFSRKNAQKIVQEGTDEDPADKESTQNAGRRKFGCKSPHSSFASQRPQGRWYQSIFCLQKWPGLTTPANGKSIAALQKQKQKILPV